MSLENASSHGESTYKKKNFPVLQELHDEQDCLSVIVNDQEGNQLQGIILEDHELLGTTLTAVTLPDGTHAFLANQGQNLELDGKDGDEDVHRSILIRDVSGVEGKVVHLEVDPVAVQSQLGTSKSSETYTQIQIINGTAYMITSRPDTGSVKSKKNDKTIFVKETETRSKYSCPREGCNKVYTTPHHLKVHERSHTGLRPYECGFSKCNKSFSTGYSLKAHLRTHTGEKPYKCTTSTCEKSFKTSGDLLKHIRTHTGERPFLCPFEGCGRSFTTSNIRKVHIRTHTGERPYKCRLCDKAFASATNYKNHVRIHSQEKPYTCGVENCGKAFTEYSSLYKHRLVHTQAKPFECNFCLKSYRQGSTLVMHKRTAHALIESDEGMDVYSETEQSGEQHNLQKRRAKQNKIIISETGPLDISEATEDSSDNETQIFLVGDPKQLVTLQQMGLEENFDDSIMDTSLEGLNIKIEGMEFAWN